MTGSSILHTPSRLSAVPGAIVRRGEPVRILLERPELRPPDDPIPAGAPNGTLASADAPSREVCVVRRDRTNTPLQALVLLNDPTFVEAARALAESVLTGTTSEKEALAEAFQRALSRPPLPEESAMLLGFVAEQQADFQGAPDRAQALLDVGSSMPAEGIEPAKLAAWTLLCSVIFNLDEFLTRS